MAAITSGVYFGVPADKINNAIASYNPENNRSQKIITKNNSILLDAYNANPTSMKGAITSFVEYKFNNPYLLLGDMFELGKYSGEEHQAIVDILLNDKVKNVIIIGNEFSKTKNHPFISLSNTQDAFEFLSMNKICNANILVKGSRGMKLEKLLEVL
jgi:UDP-N-acetylmuramoyl-tripeptide--D-alanyl-D-alanine ligase